MLGVGGDDAAEDQDRAESFSELDLVRGGKLLPAKEQHPVAL